MGDITLWQGDCLDLMKDIPDKSIDMVLCDLPYGKTACKWDSIIPFEPLWKHYKRIVKNTGVIALFGSEPFSSHLRISNEEHFLYDWIWEKEQGANFMLCKYQPYKIHEIVSIFSNTINDTAGNDLRFAPIKNYFYDEREKTGLRRSDFDRLLGNRMASHYFSKGIQWSFPVERDYKKLQTTRFFQKTYAELKKEYELIRGQVIVGTVYNPQMTSGKPYISGKGTSGDITGNVKKVQTLNAGQRYPRSVLRFNTEKKKSLHPVQKPVALLEYLVKTYTDIGGVVLDNCMGSGSTGVACKKLDRNFIGIELEEKYFDIAKKRIDSTQVAIPAEPF